MKTIVTSESITPVTYCVSLYKLQLGDYFTCPENPGVVCIVAEREDPDIPNVIVLVPGRDSCSVVSGKNGRFSQSSKVIKLSEVHISYKV